MSDFADGDVVFNTTSESIVVTGSLKHVTGFTGFNESNPEEQSGYYLPFVVKPEEDGATVSVQVDGKDPISSPEDNTFIILLGADEPTSKKKVITINVDEESIDFDTSGLVFMS